MKKVQLFFAMLALLIFLSLTACSQKAGEAADTGETRTPDTGYAGSQEDGKTVDLCRDVDLMNGDLALLYKDLENAENELEGLKIDLEYAKQDKVDVAEVELLIKNQGEYISKINSLINELQKTISEC